MRLQIGLLLVTGLMLAPADAQVMAQSSPQECAPYFDATASEGRSTPSVVPDRLLGDSTTAIRCLALVLTRINQQVGPRGLPPEAVPRLLSATAALRTLMSRGSQPGETAANAATLNDFIKAFREVDSIEAISALSWGARSDSYDLRLNSVLILGNVIDNSTVCVPLAHLNDPTLTQTPSGINGRANLLGVVSVVAPWAYKDNYDNIQKTIGMIKGAVAAAEGNVKTTASIIANIETRLGSQKDDSNKRVRLPPEWRAPCQTYVNAFVPKIGTRQNLKYDPD